MGRILNSWRVGNCGIDLLTDDTGYTWVIELNFAPNIAGFSRVAGLNAAGEMIKSLIK